MTKADPPPPPRPPSPSRREVRLRLVVGLAQLATGTALVIALITRASPAVLLGLVLLSAVVVGFSRLRWHGR